jgi:hypothetical protein
MYVGRTVCGLPSDSHEFAILPPHFEARDAVVDQSLRIMFPNVPDHLGFVAEFALASLVFHSAFLKEKLHGSHPLFNTPLFKNVEMLTGLTDRVRCGFSSSRAGMRATGVPPQVAILSRMKDSESTTLTTIDRQNRGKPPPGGCGHCPGVGAARNRSRYSHI